MTVSRASSLCLAALACGPGGDDSGGGSHSESATTWKGLVHMTVEEGGFSPVVGTCDAGLTVTLPEAAGASDSGLGSFHCETGSTSPAEWTLTGTELTETSWNGTIDIAVAGHESGPGSFHGALEGGSMVLVLDDGFVSAGGEWYYVWAETTVGLQRE